MSDCGFLLYQLLDLDVFLLKGLLGFGDLGLKAVDVLLVADFDVLDL